MLDFSLLFSKHCCGIHIRDGQELWSYIILLRAPRKIINHLWDAWAPKFLCPSLTLPPSHLSMAGCALLKNHIIVKWRPHKPQRSPALATRHGRTWLVHCHIFLMTSALYSLRAQLQMSATDRHLLYGHALDAWCQQRGRGTQKHSSWQRSGDMELWNQQTGPSTRTEGKAKCHSRISFSPFWMPCFSWVLGQEHCSLMFPRILEHALATS